MFNRMSDLIRLHYAPDNASLCVRLALDIAKMPYETTLVDRAARQQKDPAYLALNPNGLIPTLETPDGVIFETGAILLWIADRQPGTLFPELDAAGRGTALTWLFWVSNTLHPTLRMWFYPAQYAQTPSALQSLTHTRLVDQLSHLNTVWPKINHIALLQCYVAPLLRWCALYGEDTRWFDLSQFAHLAAFATHFEATPHAQTAAIAEGLGDTPFSNPSFPNPPEGSAT